MFSKLFNKESKETLNRLENDFKTKQIILKSLTIEIDTANKKLNELKAGILTEEQNQVVKKYQELGKYGASVDWDAMNAFSIERIYSKSIPNVHCTSIGYMVNNNVKEWVLFVDEDNHNKLVAEFNEYVAKKDNV